MPFKILARIFLVLAVFVAAVFAALYLLRPVAVVAVASRGTAVDAVPGTVSVRAERLARLVSDVGGRIEKSSLELGAPVSEGDVLVEIDARSLRVEIKQTEADIASIRRTLELGSPLRFDLQNQKDDLVTKERLLERGSVAKVEVERLGRAISQLEQRIEVEKLALEDRVEALENNLELKKIQLGKMTIRAPIDGVVSQIFAFRDDLIGGGTTIAEIISHTRIVSAKISEENFAGVQVEQEAKVIFTGYGDAEPFKAKVTQRLPAADPDTQRYTVYLEVDIPPERLVPGLTGEALITLDQHDNALLIPRAALIGEHVFLIEDGRSVLRTIKIGFRGLNDVEVLEGLEEGDLVAVDNIDLLRDGGRVRVRKGTGSEGAGE